MTSGTNIFVLNAGYRPNKQKIVYSADSSNTTAILMILTTGEVQIIKATNNGWLTLEGISFSTNSI